MCVHCIGAGLLGLFSSRIPHTTLETTGLGSCLFFKLDFVAFMNEISNSAC